MLYSQAEILRQAMIDLGLGTDPNLSPLQPWPIYADGEPPSPDLCITVFSTGGKVDTRMMNTGQSVQRPGVQIRVRSVDSRTGRNRMENILQVLTEQLYRLRVTISTGVNEASYFIHCLTDFGNIIALGKNVPHDRRSIFTLNAMMVHSEVIENDTMIVTVNGIPLTVAGATNMYTVPAGKTFIPQQLTVRQTSVNLNNNDWIVNLIRLSDAARLSDDMVANTTGGGVGTNYGLLILSADPPDLNVEAGDTVQFNVETKDSGTTNVVSVDLIGYLVNATS